MEGLCVNCKKKPIDVKKHSLCKWCYAKLRKNGELTDKNVSQHRCEMEFVKNYFKNRGDWIYHPATFNLENNEKYQPDFYDKKRNVFIEVVGTRQAYHKNKHKYDLLRAIFPKIEFEIRTKDGGLLKIDKNNRVVWP